MMDQTKDVKVALLEINDVTKCEVTAEGNIKIEANLFLQYVNTGDKDVTLHELKFCFRQPQLLHNTTAKFVGKTIKGSSGDTILNSSAHGVRCRLLIGLPRTPYLFRPHRHSR